jgi:hypothetical protein
MAPAATCHIENAGALPDLLFGGAIFNFNRCRMAIVARWARNLDDVTLLFHDFVWLVFGRSGIAPRYSRS